MDLIAGLIQTAILAGGVLALAALGEVLAERVGVVNLGVEGLISLGAITGIATVVAVPNPVLGFVCALLVGFVVGMIFATATVIVRSNQILCGLALTLMGTGVAAVIGHIWTAFAGFRGGKGINTALGMLIGIAPVELAVAVGIFLLVVFASGYVSLGSIIAAVALPTTMLVRYNIFHVDIEGYHTLIFFCVGLAVLIIYTHRANIRRLAEGRESRFNKLRIFHR